MRSLRSLIASWISASMHEGGPAFFKKGWPRSSSAVGLSAGSLIRHLEKEIFKTNWVEQMQHVLGKEVLHFCRPFVGFFERRNALGRDQEQGTQRRMIHVWRLTFSHLHQHYSEGPNVNLLPPIKHFINASITNLCIVFVSSDNFRGHPIRCSNYSLAFLTLTCQLGCVTKISYNKCQWHW